MTFQEFLGQRNGQLNQFFPHPQAKGTVLVSSHIWWTEQIALAVYNLGYNLLIHFPFYFLYTDEAAWNNFDGLWDQIRHNIKEFKVDLILAGNSTAMAPHPKTHEMLHDAAGIPVVNYWWDEPRATPPFASRGSSPQEYLAMLTNPRALNVIWDIDVLEELAAFYGLTNTVHVPLATDPGFWQQTPVPMDKRAIRVCFLGNCHFDSAYVETDEDPLVRWARQVIDAKIANLDRPMTACLKEVGAAPTASKYYDATKQDWANMFRPWEFLNAVYMQRTRNHMVKAAAEHLKKKLVLIGNGWDKIGLTAQSRHAQEKSGYIYVNSQVSLNLFGGCVHGGMPLRPFDIAASSGLLVTHYQRELPGLFDVGKECLAFRNADEMIAAIDRVLAAPQEFEAMVAAGRQRVLTEHTWMHRMEYVLQAARERFAIR